QMNGRPDDRQTVKIHPALHERTESDADFKPLDSGQRRRSRIFVPSELQPFEYEQLFAEIGPEPGEADLGPGTFLDPPDDVVGGEHLDAGGCYEIGGPGRHGQQVQENRARAGDEVSPTGRFQLRSSDRENRSTLRSRLALSRSRRWTG